MFGFGEYSKWPYSCTRSSVCWRAARRVRYCFRHGISPHTMPLSKRSHQETAIGDHAGFLVYNYVGTDRGDVPQYGLQWIGIVDCAGAVQSDEALDSLA